MKQKQRFVVALGLLILVALFSPKRTACQNEQAAYSTEFPPRVSVEETLKATERSWLKAEQNHDDAAFQRIVADDWSALTPDGKLQTKAERAAEIANNKNLSSATLSDIRVRVFGSTAVVTGSDDEVTLKDGKGVTDHYVWMDVFMKRNGQWLAVASQTALVK